MSEILLGARYQFTIDVIDTMSMRVEGLRGQWGTVVETVDKISILMDKYFAELSEWDNCIHYYIREDKSEMERFLSDTTQTPIDAFGFVRSLLKAKVEELEEKMLHTTSNAEYFAMGAQKEEIYAVCQAMSSVAQGEMVPKKDLTEALTALDELYAAVRQNGMGVKASAKKIAKDVLDKHNV